MYTEIQMLLPKIQTTNIIVGIPSYNESDSIGFVAKQVDEGLKKYFPDLNSLIINIDNSPDDLTIKAFQKTNISSNKLSISASSLNKGKGANIRILLEIAQTFNSQVTVMVDSDLLSITPEWIRGLVTPIMNGFDLATPLYSRNHLDGTITNNIVYPLTYGLVGKDVRQPIGGEFGFSKKLVNYWLEKKWDDTTYFYGIDNFMSINAIVGDFKLCQVMLGAKIHKPSAPKLDEMFTQVVNTLAGIITNTDLKSRELLNVPVFGDNLAPPQEMTVNIENIKKTTLDYWKKSRDYLQKVLSKVRFDALDEGFAKGNPYINDSLWAEVVYSLLADYSKSLTLKEKLLSVEALKPLYFARVLSYIKETENLNEEQSEALIKHQAKIFRKKRYFYFDLLQKKIKH